MGGTCLLSTSFTLSLFAAIHIYNHSILLFYTLDRNVVLKKVYCEVSHTFEQRDYYTLMVIILTIFRF